MGARKLLILLATVATVAGGLVIGRAISKSGPSSSPPMIQGSATLDTLPRRIIDPTPAHDAARWMTSLTHDQHPSVVVFWDFTCPISREYFFEVVPNLADVSIGFAHLPLLGPGAGLDAAVAAECAGLFGRFWEFARIAFEHQSELEELEWTEMAQRAGIADLEEFLACLSEEAPIDRVFAGWRAAHRIGVIGTPAVLVGDLYFPYPPRTHRLIEVVDGQR
jgi:protein-disulfide isomerase